MTRDQRTSVPLRILIHLIFTMAIVWLVSTYMYQYFSVTGGLLGYLIVAALLTLMDIITRPILHVLLLPFRFFFTLPAIIAANALFLWLIEIIAEQFNPNIVILTIEQGWIGWLFVACLLGLFSWLIKAIQR